MKRAILLGTTGAAVAVAMLAVGFVAGRPQPAMAEGHAVRRPSRSRPPIRSTARRSRSIIRDYLLANPEVLLEVQEALDAKQKEEQRDRAARRSSSDAKDQIFNSAHRRRRRQSERQGHHRRVLRLQLRLLQTRHRGHAGDDHRRSGPALRAQGIPDPRPGFAEGQRRLDGVPPADAGEIRRVPQRSCSAATAAPARRRPSRSPSRSAPTRRSCARR